MKRRDLFAAAAATAIPSLAVRAQSSPWPTRPVRWIVPWGAGGSTDVIARTIAQKLTERWGQQVNVDNKPGGNSIVGAVEAMRAAPDGYTLFMPHSATLTVNPFMYAKLPYDPLRDFTPIALLATYPLVVMASDSAPAKTLLELIELARKNPGMVSFGSAAGAQIQTEQWMRDWGVKFNYVIYKSGIDITKALLSGEVHLAVDAISNNLPHIKAGKIKGLAVNSPKRMAALSDVPSMDELKLKHTEPQIWTGLAGPAGLPAQLQSKINADVQAVLAMPDVQERLVKELGLDLLPGMGAAEYVKKVRTESAAVGPLIKELGLKAE
jgi:tripartite-type tricarboxylate transporter receptor subunit TctC